MQFSSSSSQLQVTLLASLAILATSYPIDPSVTPTTTITTSTSSTSTTFEQAATGPPTGNEIFTPPTSQTEKNVPLGTPYKITWTPSTPGPITLLLLKGPSTNVVPIKTIATGIANNGSYEWTPMLDLVPSDQEGYGIQLIDDVTHAYQYSPQFGICLPKSWTQARFASRAGVNATWSGSC